MNQNASPGAHRPAGASQARRSTLAAILALAGFIALSLAAGGIGSIASVNSQDFYTNLSRPSWAPPSWLFGPVWTALYILMGIAAWLVWREGPARAVTRGLTLFVAQLVLNALWTWIFFAWRLGAIAFLEIVALWLVIALTIAAFWRVRALAGALLIPYILWVTYAAALTFAVWRGNPGAL